MAVNLSGMFANLAQASQPVRSGAVPSNPMQQNVMQRFGVTDPLLQQFGQGLGGLLGAEMRSPAAIAQAEQKAQQEQARQVFSQAMTESPERQLELASQLMNIPGYEASAMKLAQQAQAQLEQGKKQLEQGQQEISSSLNATRRQQTLASALADKGYTTLASLVRQGDEDAYAQGIEIITKGQKGKDVVGSPKDRGLYRDSQGNEYAATQFTYSDGSSEIVYIDQATGEQVQSLGKDFKRIGKTGETVTEERQAQSAADIATARGEKWAISVDEAITNLPDLQYSLNSLRRARDILKELPEGPLAASTRQTFFNIFGKRPESDSEAARIISAQVMETLQGFSGSISEGERAWAVEQSAQLSNDRAKNLGILTEMERRAQLLLRKAQIMSESETSAEFRQKLREEGLLEDYAAQKEKGESFTVGNYQVKVK